MSNRKLAKAGTLLCVNSDEYGDCSVTGFFVVLRDFDQMAELAAYLEAHPEQKGYVALEQSAYLDGLLAKGLLMKVEYDTLYVGNTGLTAWLKDEETRG